jgi:hypothetical protein
MDFVSNIGVVFQKGGLVMYPLLVCSVFVVAIAVERFSYYRSNQGKPGFLLETYTLAIIRPPILWGPDCYFALWKIVVIILPYISTRAMMGMVIACQKAKD